ncbi:DEAD/DEAH box helicase family protein [Corynebacterium belfantii]|uniref:DEAD/DEAH box helicase n=1 Tax=Corynebacterium belfantii TaxID=2014537 RepID=UPI0018D3AB12|nr:DEAD/DEAH box helicase family protein [Corynebacterium belfantii]MBG9309503.1 DEAD/DEAH box helicase family protein [Corynebacterium belfantii]
MSLNISYDENLIAQITAKFDLRQPNVDALTAIVKRLESGDFDPQEQLVLDLATGVGKTYIMASLVEYLRRQGVMNVMLVTPNTVVQQKTVADFTQGSNRYIGGFDIPPALVTPDDVHKLRLGDSWYHWFAGENAPTVYIFNVQQLFPPKDEGKNEATGVEAQRRKTWRFQEETGILAERLIALDDLVVIVDEAHLFGTSAARFQESLKAFRPAATVGLTASSSKGDEIVYRYPLWKAIYDGFVKQPVLVYRDGGYKQGGEERQLQDAMSLLALKEEAYRAHREAHPDGKQTKPLLFVVCADVNHATETATTLRNTYFTGPNAVHAVLQVDNQHDDATTQTLLRNLDEPNSPVRVIVSVNKLREGWDTKRIAVMCTLRAMGSDVLTQQVMGRGLRLPFGQLTGVPAIDELDIISHRSFVELLKSENVLREFGIEEDIPGATPQVVLAPSGGKVSPVVNPQVGGGDSTDVQDGTEESGGRADEGTSEQDAPGTGTTHGGSGLPIGTRNVADDEEITSGEEVVRPVVVTVNKAFAGETFTFPSSTMTETQRPFALVDIPTSAIVEAAKKVTDRGDLLDRAKIIAEETADKLGVKQMERQSVPSFRESTSEVERELTNKLMRTRLFQATRENDAVLRRSIVPQFMQASGVEKWTVKAKESAVNSLLEMVKREAKVAVAKNTFTEVIVHPLTLPVQTSYALPAEKTVHEPLKDINRTTRTKDSGFEVKQYYGPWDKGLFDSASFDSFTAEYQLARLLNFDPDVKWWTRIYEGHKATVAYTTRNDYIPDFVVLNKDGTYWIVEGKADDKREDETVLRKREATERLLRSLVAHPDYQDQKWAYLIAFESDIRACDSFAELISVGGVERMLPN